MKEDWKRLRPVEPLRMNFNQSESHLRLGKQKTSKEKMEDAANQSFLRIEEHEGQDTYLIYGDLEWFKIDKEKWDTFVPLYVEELSFWLERSVRNDIVNVESGKFHLPNTVDKTYWLEQHYAFYKNAFIDNNPVELYLHHMLTPEEAIDHNHKKDDKSITFKAGGADYQSFS